MKTLAVEVTMEQSAIVYIRVPDYWEPAILQQKLTPEVLLETALDAERPLWHQTGELTASYVTPAPRPDLGCSRIAQALGVCQWGTAYQLWKQYTGKAPWPDLGNQLRVALGEPMEDVLRLFVADLLGRDLRLDRKEYLHESLPLIGHVDYRASALNGEKRPIVDMKTSLGFGARHRFGADGTDEVDDDVLLQM